MQPSSTVATMVRDQNKQRETRLFRHGSREIRELLNEWDPIPGSPSDEYDCLIPQLYALLSFGADASQVERYVTDELRNHFGIEPDPSREHASRTSVAVQLKWLRPVKRGSANSSEPTPSADQITILPLIFLGRLRLSVPGALRGHS